MSDAEFIDYKSYFQWFMAAALLLLLGEFFLGERHRPKRTRPAAFPVQVLLFVVAGLAITLQAKAQDGNPQVRSGNRYYKKKQLDQSLQQYQSAVQKAPDNPAANYNLGNAQFRKNSFDDAAKSYDASVSHTTDKAMQEKGLYNKGVAMIRQKKLQDGIDAWKSALKLDATDADARENLEKALMELKRQQQQQQQQQQQKKEQKNKKEDKKDQQQQQEPKPQPSRLNKQQVEQLLKALQQKENDLQNKLNQNKIKAPNQPEKDW